ncbi:MAG: imidazole glycerol phosphate synthase subunit HisH [Planctomycetes bacterium]|nr:imidazole glycerol phosphate synthase subunit HisH [Planctomycetota bacterium]
MARIAILDYDAGNLTSVLRAVEHLGGDAAITRDPAAVRGAEKVIFPGVGAARASMESLRRLGLAEEIRRAFAAGKPILGICIGCQVIFSESEEDGGVPGLDLLPGQVVRFRFAPAVSRKIPHMGWNRVEFAPGERHPVFAGLESGSEFYFVHSYYPRPRSENLVQGTAVYGGIRFAAAIAHEHLAAVQFHAEKSGPCGLKVLENFLNWRP